MRGGLGVIRLVRRSIQFNHKTQSMCHAKWIKNHGTTILDIVDIAGVLKSLINTVCHVWKPALFRIFYFFFKATFVRLFIYDMRLSTILFPTTFTWIGRHLQNPFQYETNSRNFSYGTPVWLWSSKNAILPDRRARKMFFHCLQAKVTNTKSFWISTTTKKRLSTLVYTLRHTSVCNVNVHILQVFNSQCVK